jgi:hypothetical protein
MAIPRSVANVDHFRDEVLIVGGQEFLNRLLQHRHAPEHPATDLRLGDFAELHLIQSRAAGRREMETVLGASVEPPFHRRRLLCGVVVHHDVDVVVHHDVDLDPRFTGGLGVDRVEELLRPVTPVALADRVADRNVHRHEQRGRPVAECNRGPTLGLSRCHRQQWLGGAQGLDLALLVDRQDEGVLRRARGQPDDVAERLDEERVGRELKGLAFVTLQTEGVPDPDDRTLRQSDGFGQGAGAPVGGARELLLQGLGDDLLDDRVRHYARCAGILLGSRAVGHTWAGYNLITI